MTAEQKQAPRILWICSIVPKKLGGFEALCASVAAAVSRRGGSMYFSFAGEPSAEVSAELEAAGGVVVNRTDVLSSWHESSHALRLIERVRADIVHLHFQPVFSWLSLRFMGKSTTLVASYRYSDQPSGSSLLKNVVKHIRDRTFGIGLNHVFAVSCFARDLLLSNYAISANKVSVLHNGVATGRFLSPPQPPEAGARLAACRITNAN